MAPLLGGSTGIPDDDDEHGASSRRNEACDPGRLSETFRQAFAYFAANRAEWLKKRASSTRAIQFNGDLNHATSPQGAQLLSRLKP